ncbi:shufflon system plasmid conjugative transfer pilus tip adhesin PilV [Xenorhabdus sp. TS4]|uniref:shufflon system plasmid conjugative transfer pilus tip adhesin PilV n=1 Tax=Xenorhabdus sp. TS4 TaxID=1873483 RepID=UPI00165715D0|nr:shufflon system plasmid conjugative transfer pilus tip adhesin PilV [Xenorhabdus sp. TS4]MBC8950070.1 type IV pilus biogenesis protein PilV [Xenorhabdus sp. TS4]
MTVKFKTSINRGFSLVSLAFVLAIVLIAAPIGMQKYADYTDQRAWNGTAEHINIVSQGSRRYIRDNYNTLLNQVKNGKSVDISSQTLLEKGYLPAGFSLTNNNNQTYVLSIAKNSKKNDIMVAFVITTGGHEIPFKGLRFISQGITGLGGYIYPANIANGAGGGWQVNLSNLGLKGQSGHIVSYLSSEILGTDAEESDRLYRFKVNGRPDLNRMHTSIDLNNNDIDNGGEINAQKGNFNDDLTVNNDIKSNNGWIITHGNKGWMNGTYGGGFYMSDGTWIRTLNKKGIHTDGQVKALDRISTGEYLQLGKPSVIGTACSSNGLISRDDEGALLSCQSGEWKSNGGGGDYVPVNISIPASGLIDLNQYVPNAKAVQIRGTGENNANGNCCPRMGLNVDSVNVFGQGFDTSTSGERTYSAFTFITSSGSHNFTWYSWGWWREQPTLTIIGYWK